MRWLVAFALLGCAKPNAAPSELEVKLSMARAIADGQVKDIHTAIDAERARAAKPAWTPEAYLEAEQSNNLGFFSCAAASGALPQLRMVADPRVFVLAQLCDHDLPLASLAAAVAIVEATPSDRSHCMMVQIGRHEAFAHRGGDFAALRARYEHHCGKQLSLPRRADVTALELTRYQGYGRKRCNATLYRGSIDLATNAWHAERCTDDRMVPASGTLTEAQRRALDGGYDQMHLTNVPCSEDAPATTIVVTSRDGAALQLTSSGCGEDAITANVAAIADAFP